MPSHLRNLYEKSMRVLKNNKGQGLVEYALILVLIAIVVVAAVTNLGTTTSKVLENVNTAIKK
jgi:pilus assembly protein Flp/PilA